jgi:PIN domain nuclease of toxin-antitoxin system
VILLDTNAVIWSTLYPSELSKAAQEALRVARLGRTGAGISDTTLWELALLISRGRVQCPMSMGQYLQLVEARFIVFPVTAEIAEVSTGFSNAFPKDPTDRLIAATALVHKRSLVTADGLILKSGEVPCIW